MNVEINLKYTDRLTLPWLKTILGHTQPSLLYKNQFSPLTLKQHVSSITIYLIISKILHSENMVATTLKKGSNTTGD